MATEVQVVASSVVRSTPAARRTAALILALIFSLTLVLSAIVPLLPRFVDRFHLSTVEAGALFSIVTGVMVAASLPVGLLADRFGPRPLALGAVVFLVGSCFLQGLASSYGMLLAGRAVFGIAHTTIWASTLVWLTQLDLSPRARPMLLGGTMTVSGAGFSVGPFLVGFLADRFGIFVPFAAAAAFATLVALRLAGAPAPPRLAAEERPRLREMVQQGHDRMPGVGNDVADPSGKELAYEMMPIAGLLSLSQAADELAGRLGDIACPVLVANSPQDHVVPPSSSDLIASSVRGPLERLTLARSYHVATLDYDRHELEQAAVDFARKVTSAA